MDDQRGHTDAGQHGEPGVPRRESQGHELALVTEFGDEDDAEGEEERFEDQPSPDWAASDDSITEGAGLRSTWLPGLAR